MFLIEGGDCDFFLLILIFVLYEIIFILLNLESIILENLLYDVWENVDVVNVLGCWKVV